MNDLAHKPVSDASPSSTVLASGNGFIPFRDIVRVVDTSTTSGIAGTSEAIRSLMRDITFAASADFTVLIKGETGTGKELVANAIHNKGPRRRQRIVVINCPATPEGLVESELFGYDKRPFTGASSGMKKGRIELAQDGTLFFDEIGKASIPFQNKILRFLQERTISTVGTVYDTKINARVLAATNVDLAEEVKQGRFMEDLFYRLNEFSITVPKLRDRIGDIPELVYHLIKKWKKTEREIEGIEHGALALLQQQPFSGNVRELESCIRVAVNMLECEAKQGHDGLLILSERHVSRAFSGHPKDGAALPQHHNDYVSYSADLNLNGLLAIEEKRIFTYFLRMMDGNAIRVAKALGISRYTAYRRIDKYGLRDEAERLRREGYIAPADNRF